MSDEELVRYIVSHAMCDMCPQTACRMAARKDCDNALDRILSRLEAAEAVVEAAREARWCDTTRYPSGCSDACLYRAACAALARFDAASTQRAADTEGDS